MSLVRTIRLTMRENAHAASNAEAPCGEPWFDGLFNGLVRKGGRRSLLRAFAAVMGFRLAIPRATAGKNSKPRKRSKGKGQRKDQGKPRTKRMCSEGACAGVWLGQQREITFCEDKCHRCKRAGTAFCILPPDDQHPFDHASCCPVGQECCFGNVSICCDSGRCCTTANGARCLEAGETCCPSDAAGFCHDGAGCCPSQGCRRCDAPQVLNSATCECECVDDVCRNNCDGSCNGPDVHCCNGVCRNTRFDSDHCGAQCQRCSAFGLACCDGQCVDLNLHCGACAAACQAGEICCHGAGRGCIDGCGGFCTCGAP